ncbi:15622_t:CDS:1, partial [Gigaspora rosea]
TAINSNRTIRGNISDIQKSISANKQKKTGKDKNEIPITRILKLAKIQRQLYQAITDENVQKEIWEIADKIDNLPNKKQLNINLILENTITNNLPQITAQWQIENSNISLKHTVKKWPSNNKLLGTALICIMLTIPEKAQIKISTNIKPPIKNIQMTMETPPYNLTLYSK